MKRHIPKPFSEMSRDEKIVEAKAAIRRLEASQAQFWTRTAADAVRGWRETLKKLEGSR